MTNFDPFLPWLRRWRLFPDGQPLQTHSSDLLPVRTADDRAAMLKLPHDRDEQRGSVLMLWWQGQGAAEVLADDPDGALLMERAEGAASLTAMALDGADDAATTILCAVAASLHAPRGRVPPGRLQPLSSWFEGLWPVARSYPGVLARAADIARGLLAAPRELIPLHGDLHHDNVLDFGPRRGWLAIDPKGLLGEAGFDYGNIFSNPQPAGQVSSDVALLPGVFERRLHRVMQLAPIEPMRLLQWVIAYSALSAAWVISDGDDAGLDLGVLARAFAVLDYAGPAAAA